MAEPVLLNDCKIWLAGYDLTGYCNAVEISSSKGEKANSRFGDTAETFYPGVQAVRARISGFFSSESALAADPVIWAQLDPAVTAADWPLFMAPPYFAAATAGAEGNLGYMVVGKQFSNVLGAPHGELLPFTTDTLPASTYKLYRQTVERANTLVSATTTSTGRQYGALLATDQLTVSLHVFAITGGSWVLTIQSDDNSGFTTPTLRDTFTAVTTAPTYQVRKTVGAVTDDWWRCILTKTGGTNITYAVTMGKQTIV